MRVVDRKKLSTNVSANKGFATVSTSYTRASLPALSIWYWSD